MSPGLCSAVSSDSSGQEGHLSVTRLGASSFADAVNSVSLKELDLLDRVLFPAGLYPATVLLVLISCNGERMAFAAGTGIACRARPCKGGCSPVGCHCGLKNVGELQPRVWDFPLSWLHPGKSEDSGACKGIQGIISVGGRC